MNQPIVIVGAGPVGLTAACLLHHFDIPFVIFDKKEERTKTSNALLINMRTLQLLKPLGIADKFIERGLHLAGLSIYASKKKLMHIDIKDANLPYRNLKQKKS